MPMLICQRSDVNLCCRGARGPRAGASASSFAPGRI
jgi:hypothetical protein